MAMGHAVVTLPKHGRGSHPENGALAIDGRGKNMLAPSGLVGSSLQTGALFWAITRTTKASEANMILENVSFESTVKVHLPAPKKRRVESNTWGPTENPQVPILVSKGALKKHIQLFVFQAEKKKEPEKKA